MGTWSASRCARSLARPSVPIVKSIGQKAYKKFDTPSKPYFVDKTNRSRHGARCEKTEAPREYRQAKDCLRKLYRTNKAQSAGGSNGRICTENRSTPSDGTKIPADVLRRSRVRTILTSRGGTSGGGMRIIRIWPHTHTRSTQPCERKIGLL